jgi:peptidyl-dipeptidase Dcp
MAKTPEAVRSLLERVWKPARAWALADRDALQALIAAEGGNFSLAPWDWRYYAEKLRQAKANFDDAAIKPYLVLDHMIEAAFDCATRLFGITFAERRDIPVWHPDVRIWEVRDRNGQHKALFYGDTMPAVETFRRLMTRCASAEARRRVAPLITSAIRQGRRRRAVAAVAG